MAMSFPQPRPPAKPQDKARKTRKMWMAAAIVVVVVILTAVSAGRILFTHPAPLRIDPFGLGPEAVIAPGAPFDNRPEVRALPVAVRGRFLAAEAAQADGRDSTGDSVWTLLRSAADFPVTRVRAILAQLGWKPVEDSLAATPAARAALDSALVRWPAHPLLLYLRGRLLQAAGRADSAEADYRRAEKLSPRFAFPHVRLGEGDYRRGDWKQAETEFRTAFSLWKTDPGAYTGRFGAVPGLDHRPFAGLAQLFFQRGHTDSAQLVLDYAAQSGAAGPELDFLRARIDEERDQLTEADSIYRALAAEYPQRARYAEAAATVGLKPPRGALGPSAHASAVFAISLLQPLTLRFPQDAALRLALGQAYLYRGLPALAAAALDTALLLDGSLAEARPLRDAAYRAWRESPGFAADTAPAPQTAAAAPRSDSEADDDGVVQVIVPGSTALLGTYDVAWGSTPEDVRRAYPNKVFTVLPNGDLREIFSQNGRLHDYLLAFKQGMLWGVYVRVTDTTRSGSDLFGEVLQLKSKISGVGKGTGETTCPDGRTFQGVIWENDDTFEFLAQFNGHDNQVRLARLAESQLPGNHRVCDVAHYLDPAAWR